MNPRERRLYADLEQMNEQSDNGMFQFRCEGDPPDRYEVMFEGQGLAIGPDKDLAVRTTHRFDAYLHLDYPRKAPLVNWKSNIFHPNILSPDRRGGVCIGSWSPSESLADLCRRLKDLATYRSFNCDDALDKGAALWLLETDFRPGDPVERLLEVPLPKADLV